MAEEKAVVYARYSSHNQTEQSIEGQLAAARKYASLHNYVIVQEYCDRAKTGTNDNRDAFQKMLSDCSKKQFSVIIVWKVDRFGRNREEITFNKYKAKKNGVRVEYVAESISEGPEGVILESVLEGMAEYYSLQLSQNVKRGLLESAKKYQVIGGHTPLGYKTGPDKRYAIDPDTAPVVKQIFEKYASGLTMAQLTRWLNDSGYRTPKGKKFTKNSLPRILSNEKYTGVYIYKDLIRQPGEIPAIIDQDLFDQVQNMLKRNKRMPSHSWNYSDYLLTNKLFCGKCGKQMVGKSGYGRHGGKYEYYCCKGRLENSGCDKSHVQKDWIEEKILKEVLFVLNDEAFMNFLIDTIWEYYLKQDTESKEIENMTRKLETVGKAIENLVRSVEEGMPYKLVKNRMEELEEERAAIQKYVAEAELKRGLRLTKEHIAFFLEQFRDLKYTDRKCQTKLIETFVNSIYLYDNELTIAFNYSGENNTITLTDIEKANTCFVRTCSQEQGIAHNMRTAVYKTVFLIKVKI